MIKVNLDKAKTIGHELRRAARSEEFAPFDDLIVKRIPGHDFESLEKSRQEIRDKYALIQKEIDAAKNPEEIKKALGI